ncbi:MAG: DUF2804 family protein [Thermoflexia bacterium]|nr:MAG: DUF2804 family protein [Thermoflexia bacterium]
MRLWRFTDNEGRLDLTLVPFKERVVRTSLGVTFSEAQQTFRRSEGQQ